MKQIRTKILLLMLFMQVIILAGCSSQQEVAQITEQPTTTVDEYGATIKENVEIEGRPYTYIRYELDEEGNCCISALRTKSDELIIPTCVDGHPVTKVSCTLDFEDRWLDNPNQKLKKLIVSNGITHITTSAFYGLRAEQVIIPASVKEVEWAAFGETDIQNVEIQGEKTNLGMGAFASSNLKNIKWPETYQGKIDSECFSKTKLESVQWPNYGNKKSKIEYDAFADCEVLKEVIFPENQEHIFIEDGVFDRCTSLKQLVFPATTKKVTYLRQTHADNYQKSVQELVFLGKETELEGIWNQGIDKDIISVSKIVAPKESKAIEKAKKAGKVTQIPSKYWDRLISYPPGFDTFGLKGYTYSKIKWGPMEYEET